jgi:hypothetical protein
VLGCEVSYEQREKFEPRFYSVLPELIFVIALQEILFQTHYASAAKTNGLMLLLETCETHREIFRVECRVGTC